MGKKIEINQRMRGRQYTVIKPLKNANMIHIKHVLEIVSFKRFLYFLLHVYHV